MNNKYLLAIIIAVAILLVAGLTVISHSLNNSTNNQSDTIKVHDAVFTLPEGYKIVESEKDNAEISNKYSTITIKCLGNGTVKKEANNYVKFKNKDNISVNISNFTVNGKIVFKSTLQDNANNVHYWFKYQGNVYTIYTGDANKNMDKIAFALIKSIQ